MVIPVYLEDILFFRQEGAPDLFASLYLLKTDLRAVDDNGDQFGLACLQADRA